MVIFLLFCAIVTPFEIAFVNHEPSHKPISIINFVVDGSGQARKLTNLVTAGADGSSTTLPITTPPPPPNWPCPCPCCCSYGTLTSSSNRIAS